jgi:hypothetical protein
MALDGNEPFWLFLGVVALMAAFALIRRARRPSRPGAMRWGREGASRRDDPARASPPGRWENDSSRGPGSTDSGASDGGS